MSTSKTCCEQSFETNIKQRLDINLNYILELFLGVQAIHVVDRVLKQVIKKTGCSFELSP